VDVTPAAPEEAAEAADEAPDAALLVASAADEAIDDVAIMALEAEEDVAIMALELAMSTLMEALDGAPPAADPPSLAAKDPSSRPARADTSCMPSAWLLAQKLVKVKRVVSFPIVPVWSKVGS